MTPDCKLAPIFTQRHTDSEPRRNKTIIIARTMQECEQTVMLIKTYHTDYTHG